ncbi:MAG: CARDB domain-containing protein [Candidatus Micrarchaeia archaeon]
MKKEVYFWVLLFIAVIGVAMYLRLFYEPTLSVVLRTNATLPNHIYPYQALTIPVTIYNNGHSPIKNMSVGVYVNGTLTSYYKVTLPQGKETAISIAYTPEAPGNYTVQAVADPGRLLDIADRADAQASVSFAVAKAGNETPYTLLPEGNITSESFAKLNSAGYALASDLNATYGLAGLKLTGIYNVNAFLDSVLKYVLNYISNIGVASVRYSNGSLAYSIWLQGDISPNMTNTAALINGLKARNESVLGKNVTVVSLGNNTSICSYESSGWLKILAYKGNGTCSNELDAKKLARINTSQFFERMQIANSISLGNYSVLGSAGSKAGTLAYFENTSFIYSTIQNASTQNNTCYGLINSANNDSFCSEYVFANASTPSTGTSLIDTHTYIGNYNISVYSLVNTSLLLDQVPINIGIIDGFGIKGKPVQFVSGIKNTCAFNSTFSCSNVSFANGTLSMALRSLNKTVKLNSLSCFLTPESKPNTLNETISGNETRMINATCYNAGSKLSGIELNLKLTLLLNYTFDNKSMTALGSAYIPFG